MKALRTLRIAGTFPALETAAEELALALEESGADAAAIYAARVVIEELGTNVMKYGYPEGEACWIEFRLYLDGDCYVLEVEDAGKAFDPLCLPGPDLSLPLEERPIGGLGVHLVCKLMEKVEYERSGGHNVVRVRRRRVGK